MPIFERCDELNETCKSWLVLSNKLHPPNLWENHKLQVVICSVGTIPISIHKRYRTEQAEHSKVITTDNHNHTWKYNFALSPTLQNSCPFASPKRLFSVNVNSGTFKENIGTFSFLTQFPSERCLDSGEWSSAFDLALLGTNFSNNYHSYLYLIFEDNFDSSIQRMQVGASHLTHLFHTADDQNVIFVLLINSLQYF